jgi:hypothetical protein
MSTTEDSIALLQAIDLQLKNVHTQSLDISFNELASMVEEGELDISPDYQRLFQWSEGARSRFIESLLLEMPVPPIYMVEEEDNRKLLIDGLQRLSSYLHFRGLLEAPHLNTPVKKGDMLVLEECDIIPALNGKTYTDLGTALQIKLKRSFVRTEVVRKGSDSHFKYHMFKRLNTGGEALTPQQLRNCTIRLLDARYIDFLNTLARDDAHFRICISTLSEEQTLNSYDKELVLRFFALKNNMSGFKHDVSDFLTDYLESVSQPDMASEIDLDAERSIFNKTFLILAKTLGEQAFGRADKSLTKIISAFAVYHFEAFTIGLQGILDRVDTNDTGQLSALKNAFLSIKLDAAFVALTTGGGKNSPGPLRDRIEFVSQKLQQIV